MVDISIITPVLNRKAFIDGAIQSVHKQRHPVEHIVVDGGSEDGTLGVIQKYPEIKLATGKDTGLYDAINKGIRIAKGEIIGLLNSDDEYLPGVFGTVIDMFGKHPDLEIIQGGAFIKTEIEPQRWETKPLPNLHPTNLIWDLMIEAPLMNACFIRKTVFDKMGLFITNLKIAADREWMLRCVFGGIKIQQVNQPFYQYTAHRDSLSLDRSNHIQKTKMLDEDAWIAEHFLAENIISTAIKTKIIRWNTILTVSQSFITDDNPAHGFWNCVSRGVRYDPLWLIAYLKRVVRNVISGGQK